LTDRLDAEHEENTMKCLALLFMLLVAMAAGGQTLSQTKSANAGTQCGPGELVVNYGGKQVGTETYTIDCPAGGGFSATGTTVMEIGGAKLNLTTTMEADASSVPTKFAMKGTSFGTAVDQTVVMKDGAATVTNGGVATPVSYPAGTVLLPNNLSFPMQFIVNRYDQAKGGVQDLVIFPDIKATLEFVRYDEVPAGAAAPKLGRYLLKVGTLKLFVWTEAGGRAVIFSNPGQTFNAVRKEYVPASGALLALVAAPKPDYSAPAGAAFTAEEVTVQAKGHTLAGTLLLPKNAHGKVPAVITITGSGQQNRDEQLALANLDKYRPLRQIAEALASQGIAVLRVDDRGAGDSTGIDGINDATTADFADDTRAQVAYLRTRKEIDRDRIALAGHSEGGIIGPMVAADDPKIAAIVILAGTAQRGDAVLLYQFNHGLDTPAAASLTEEQKTAARAENAAAIRTAMEGGDTSGFPPILKAPWTKWFLNYDPVPTIRKVKQPVLILQGDLDRQVIRENAGMLLKEANAAGNQQVEVDYFPTLNHLFLPSKTGDPTEYESLTVQEIPADVISTLTGWLVKTLKAK
jgi:dienelactone hydrolase